MNAPVHERSAWRLEKGRSTRVRDAVADETPVALVYNGVSHAVMMATPADLPDFALGFSLTEGIVERPDELEIIETRNSTIGISIQMLIPSSRFEALDARRRHLTGRTGCGLCGSESLDAAIRPVSRVAIPVPVADVSVRDALHRLASAQPWNARCHGLHAAAFVHGRTCDVREDVGRHNALDKLIGCLAARHVEAWSGFLVVTSRASYEIVHKAAMFGIGIVVAISAPTALAIRIAEDAGVTLIAFARGEAMTIYSHPANIVSGSGPMA